VASKDDERGSGLSDAAGRVAFFPARAAARAWRGPLEEAVDEVLSAPEIARVIDRALAGSLPEELARSIVRNRVLERIVAELAASGELERLTTAALASPQTLKLTDGVLASDETQRALRHVASSPELRDAIARQTSGLAEEVVGGVRASAARLDDRAEQIVRGPPRTERPMYGGIATRAIALATDAAVTIVLFIFSKNGLFNHLFGFSTDWFGDASTVGWGIVGMNAWTTSGTVMLFYLASLQSIPDDVYEAAALDNTGAWRTFWKITFPLLKPAHFFCLVVFGIGALKLFDQPFLIGGGASGSPNYSTMYPIIYIYNAAFGVSDFGLAAAAGVVLFVIIFGLTVVQRLTVGRQEAA
jgi:ABC-type molybdate transport system permease subunit